MTVASVSSHLVIRTWCFWKIKEKKYKININNDLAVVASHIPMEAVHDRELCKNQWNALRSRVMRSEGEREAVCSERREVQQGTKCWGCGEAGHVQRRQCTQQGEKHSKRK